MVFFNSSVFRVAAEVACCTDRYVMASFTLVQVALVHDPQTKAQVRHHDMLQTQTKH